MVMRDMSGAMRQIARRRSTGGGIASPNNAPAGVVESSPSPLVPAEDEGRQMLDEDSPTTDENLEPNPFAEMYLDLVLQSVVGALDVSCRADGWRVRDSHGRR